MHCIVSGVPGNCTTLDEQPCKSRDLGCGPEKRHGVENRQPVRGGVGIARTRFGIHKLRRVDLESVSDIGPPFARDGLICRDDQIPRTAMSDS